MDVASLTFSCLPPESIPVIALAMLGFSATQSTLISRLHPQLPSGQQENSDVRIVRQGRRRVNVLAGVPYKETGIQKRSMLAKARTDDKDKHRGSEVKNEELLKLLDAAWSQIRDQSRLHLAAHAFSRS